MFLFLTHLSLLFSFPDLLHPFSIDIFEDYIYGVTYINNVVFRVNKFGKGSTENLTTGINHATDIVLYHRYKQPESECSASWNKTDLSFMQMNITNKWERFMKRFVKILFLSAQWLTHVTGRNVSGCVCSAPVVQCVPALITTWPTMEHAWWDRPPPSHHSVSLQIYNTIFYVLHAA